MMSVKSKQKITTMKNIHKIGKELFITSNEEIKEGDWVTNGLGIMKANLDGQPTMDDYHPWKKIILTTDQELIKNSVQAIDDEFLEWFVKNPSCEEVVFSTYHVKGDISGKLHYKIIIPKEIGFRVENGRRTETFYSKEEPKQETLEEAANKIYHNTKHSYSVIPNYTNWIQGFVEGAKWQQERMYSEEDIINALHSVELKDNKDYSKIYNGMKEWLNNLKRNNI